MHQLVREEAKLCVTSNTSLFCHPSRLARPVSNFHLISPETGCKLNEDDLIKAYNLKQDVLCSVGAGSLLQSLHLELFDIQTTELFGTEFHSENWMNDFLYRLNDSDFFVNTLHIIYALILSLKVGNINWEQNGIVNSHIHTLLGTGEGKALNKY